MTPDQLDKAIKRSSMDVPPYEGKPSAPRLSGDSKQGILAQVEAAFTVDPNYDIVHVVDFPSYDKCFNYFLINYYYTQDKDPTTYLECYRVYTDGKVTRA